MTVAATLAERSHQAPSTKVAQLKAVTKNFGPSQCALRSVDLAISPGEVLCLLGPNGAGKTTAVKLMLGLLKPSAGEVRVFGADPCEPRNRMRTGAMLQIASVPETLRVREHIDLFSSYYPSPLPFAEVIETAGLHGLEHRLYGDLSGGQQRRLLFALAICGNPDLLFLDEPTVGLDVEARRGMWRQIQSLTARGKSVLLTTHYLDEADSLAHRIVVIQKGSVIAEGSPAQIKQRVSGRRIYCRTGLSLEALRSMPLIDHVEADRGRVEITSAAPDAVIRQLLERDPTLSEIEVSSGGMEEAFLALTTNTERS